MTSFLDKMNLKPQERRWVVIVVLVVFVLLNYLFVFRNFGNLGRSEKGLRETQALLKKYNDEIGRRSVYADQLKKLQAGGQFIATEEQGLRLAEEVHNQASLTGVNLISSTPGTRGTGKTNAFFDEQSQAIQFNSDEAPLVEFLFNLAARESLTRVRSMTLGPDQKRERLQGNITLVKSFQRKPPAKSAAAAAPTNAAAPKLVPPATRPAAATNVAKVVAPAAGKASGTNLTAGTTNAASATGTNTSFLKKWFNRLF
jgi:hypothetical protein